MPPSQPLPKSMPAWQHFPTILGGGAIPQTLRLNQTAAVPTLKPSSTLVKVLSAGINPVDYKIASVPLVSRALLGSASVPSMDYVGRVWATSLPESTGLKAGDLVFGKVEGPNGQGTLAAFTLVTGTEGIVRAPDGVELDWLGVTGVVGLTAYQSLVPELEDRGEGSAAGKSVFINGSSGGVGTFGIQIARAIGCENVVVTCSAANAELVKGLGATEVIDYRSVNVADAAVAWVKNKNGGNKFDLVVDNAGADMGLYWRCHEYLKEGGKYSFVGAGVDLGTLVEVSKCVMWPSFLGGGKRKFEFLALKTSRKDFERLGKWMQEGKVKVVIDSTFSMDQVPDAYRKLLTGRARGKIVVRVSEDGRGDGN